MEHLTVKCKTCIREFGIEQNEMAQREVYFGSPGFKKTYPCPFCASSHEYAAVDLIFSDPGVKAPKAS